MLSHLLLACAFASVASTLTFPDIVSLHKRQQPGTPQYECHEDCGSVITSARTENFCDSANFTTSLDACLNCAEEYNIWRYYGESVGAAAQACGLDATPVAANSTSANATSTTASASTSNSATPTGEASSSSETPTTATSSDIVSTASEQISSATSEGAAAATSANTSPELSTPGLFVGGILAVVAMWI